MKTNFCIKKSCMIPIITKISSKNVNVTNNEYSLREKFFDPIKSSPPNNFMNKLEMRMSIYNSYRDNRLDNFVIE